MIPQRLCIIGFLLACTAGCASGPCTGNPATDDLRCASAGVFSGSYQRQVTEKEANAKALQAQAQAAREENQRLDGQIADAKRQESSLRRQITAQRAELDNMTAQVNAAAAQGKLSEGETDLRRAQIERLQRQQAALQNQSTADRKELEQKAIALQREIDELKAALAKRTI
jgi:chromosome segregation ATPase